MKDKPGKDRSVEHAERVTGWWYFAGILLTIGGVLNVIWGIVAISESRFFVTTDPCTSSATSTRGVGSR